MTEPIVTSPANPQLKRLLALRRRRGRRGSAETLVEGFEELAMALSAGVAPRTVYVCPELFGRAGYAGSQAIRHQDDLVAAARQAGARVVRLSPAAFEKVSYREGPDGLLAVVPAVDRDVASLVVPANPLVLMAQSIEKPGNLGAMVRTADAAGVCAVVAVDPVTDWANPNVVRASKGTVFAVPLATARLDEALAWTRGHGVRLVVTTPTASRVHSDVDYTGAVAVVVGAEKPGVSDRLLEAADERVRIPMAGRGNSLNVAAAAAVVLYEAVRQRG